MVTLPECGGHGLIWQLYLHETRWLYMADLPECDGLGLIWQPDLHVESADGVAPMLYRVVRRLLQHRGKLRQQTLRSRLEPSFPQLLPLIDKS